MQKAQRNALCACIPTSRSHISDPTYIYITAESLNWKEFIYYKVYFSSFPSECTSFKFTSIIIIWYNWTYFHVTQMLILVTSL